MINFINIIQQIYTENSKIKYIENTEILSDIKSIQSNTHEYENTDMKITKSNINRKTKSAYGKFFSTNQKR